jgi:hypothetical protein
MQYMDFRDNDVALAHLGFLLRGRDALKATIEAIHCRGPGRLFENHAGSRLAIRTVGISKRLNKSAS